MLSEMHLHPAALSIPKARFGVKRGFTLVELLVTLSIASILMALAAPSFSSLMSRQSMKGTASDIYMTLVKARSEALKRNVSVTASKVGSSWQEGWQILDPSDVNSKLEDHGVVKNVTITGPSEITYRPSGRITADAEPVFSIRSTNTNSDKQWCVSVDLSGRPYQKSVSAGSSC